MKTRNLVWWGTFFVTALTLQTFMPGIDLLVVGVLLCLQEKNWKQFGWVILVSLLIREGSGSMDFGGGIVWYIAVILSFFVGHWLFETENYLFMMLLGVCLGSAHFFVVQLMGSLQYFSINIGTLLDESMVQAILIPIAWKGAACSRGWVLGDENPS